MADLDHAELTATYHSLRKMKLILIEAIIGGGIKAYSELKVLNYKKTKREPDADNNIKTLRTNKPDLTSTMC